MKFKYFFPIFLLLIMSSCATLLDNHADSECDLDDSSKIIGDSYIENQFYEKAEKIFAELAEQCPLNAESHYKLGFIYHKMGKIGKSRKKYEKVISLDPNYHEAYYNLGAIYSSENDIEKASFFFKQYLENKPESQLVDRIQLWLINHKQIEPPEKLKKIGNKFYNKNNLSKAKDCFEKCLPKDKEINYKLGIIYKKFGLIQKSIDQFLTVIEKDKKLKKPYYPNAFYFLHKIYLSKGEYYNVEKAKLYLNKYRQHVPRPKPTEKRNTKKKNKKIQKQPIHKLSTSEPQVKDKDWLEEQTKMIVKQKEISPKTNDDSFELDLKSTNQTNMMDKDWLQEQIHHIDF